MTRQLILPRSVLLLFLVLAARVAAEEKGRESPPRQAGPSPSPSRRFVPPSNAAWRTWKKTAWPG